MRLTLLQLLASNALRDFAASNTAAPGDGTTQFRLPPATSEPPPPPSQPAAPPMGRGVWIDRMA